MTGRGLCPKCNNKLVEPSGSGSILLIGEYPGKDEVIQGRPFVGRSGEVLHAELARLGLNMNDFRLSNLWLHGKSDTCDFEWHKNQMGKEIHGKKLVLLMGSELTEVLFDQNVTDLLGLSMESKLFPGTKMIISYNPAQAMHGPLGEFRLSLSRFAKEVERVRKSNK